MARIGHFWTGLLMAGALALVLALFGLSTASAHDLGHGAPVQMSDHGHHGRAAVAIDASASTMPLLTEEQADCHKGHVVMAAKPARNDHAPGCRCHDGCACGCASACVTHAMTGLPAGTAALPVAVSAVRLPLGRSDDLAGLTPPPEPRPPLSI